MKTIDMTEGSPLQLLIRFAIPVLLVVFWLFGHPIMRMFVSNEVMISYAAAGIRVGVECITISFEWPTNTQYDLRK